MGITIKIKDKFIGEGHPSYIIAEMSANHGGKFDRAREIIYKAKESGADCIKIQTYTADTMTINCDEDYFKIKRGLWKGKKYYDLYRQAYTPWEWQLKLKEEAEKIGLDFLSTPFDVTAVNFLEDINIDFYKIASFELIDIPLIKYIASKGKPIIMSTGMGSLEEITEAVEAIREEKNNKICLLRCSSAYPAISEEMNLKTMMDLKRKFNTVVGLSDHSLGNIAAVTAIAMGAKVIEKHFCLSRDIKTPDSDFSMEPKEFKDMVNNVRQAEKAIGKISYCLSENEKISKESRRSIFIVKDIKKGDRFTEENIKIIRPGYGLKPKYYDGIIGKTAACDIKRGTPLSWDKVI
ncbi:pseudaminic acid synthase [Clostridium sporogenes]|jgi:pseudaminic acid synthase|uniref:pseudaminic acid synthase n=1 Tax=Clostridium TaxID=1485 RepID=UPI001C0F0609|nr:pseudaminic acid synthase [Clostridium cochlearium]MBU5269552.1 pseudaminic acid synthase [Clostridium cochlearium]